MKKIAFTLYMISLIIMFPLYVILEFRRETPLLHAFNPVSIRNDEVKNVGADTVNFIKSSNIL